MYGLRPYCDNDYNFVYQVKKQAYQKYVIENWGGWVEADQQKYFDDFIALYASGTHIIVIDEQQAGFLNGEILEDGSFELGNICLKEEFRGKGLGSKILCDLIQKHKNKDIILRVFKSNPAKKLYERLGFKTIEDQKHHFKMKRIGEK